MKKLNKVTKIISLLLIALTFSCSTVKGTNDSKVINFPDENFEKVIRKKIRKPKGDIVYSDVSKITSLIILMKDVHSIEGIQNFKSLEGLIFVYCLIK